MAAQYSAHEMAVIGKRLKDYRQVRGFSQSEVAQKIGLPNGSSLSMVESGKSYSKLVLLLPELCNFYGLAPEVFTGNMPPALPAVPKVAITARDVMHRLDDLDSRMARLEGLLERLVRATEGAGHVPTQ